MNNSQWIHNVLAHQRSWPNEYIETSSCNIGTTTCIYEDNFWAPTNLTQNIFSSISWLEMRHGLTMGSRNNVTVHTVKAFAVLPPKKFKSLCLGRKVMVTIFRDAKGTLLIDDLEKSMTVTGEYYANMLQKLHAAIAQKMTRISDKRHPRQHSALQILCCPYCHSRECFRRAWSPTLQS